MHGAADTTTHEPFCDRRHHTDPALDCTSPEAVTHGIRTWYTRGPDGVRAFAEPDSPNSPPLTADGCDEVAAHFTALGRTLRRR